MAKTVVRSSVADAPPAERFGRLLASPTGVLIILPLLVLGAGGGVLLLGRRATMTSSDDMARRQLAAQADDVQRDVSFALDQAEPLLASLKLLSDPSLPALDVASRIHDLVVGRPGVANVSIAFPSGLMRGSYIDNDSGQIRVQESVVGDHGTQRTNFGFASGIVEVVDHETTQYDPRTRPHYLIATQAKQRVWMPPRTFFTSKKTGLTVTEPVYGVGGELRAVTTVDFDVGGLSAFISKPPFAGARTVMFGVDGTILAFPSVPIPAVASKESRLLRADDFGDAALTALFAALGGHPPAHLEFMTLTASDGAYLASVAPVGGKRGGIDAPLEWYVATMVPERELLGSTHKLVKQSIIASGGALAIALGVALLFAWNLLRMRKAVTVAREQARSAEERAKELGSYRLVSRIGAGGMGEVWRAEHRLLARQAAIKLVRPEALDDPRIAEKIRERFRREAQTLATMKSQHTIALYDYGATEEGTFYFVMELLDGVDLDRLVRDTGALPAARVIKLIIQACQSLAEAHEAGLLHRDIKPANLFVCRIADEVDVLKVLDFGIVHAMNERAEELPQLPAPSPSLSPSPSGRLTQVGAVVGTPGYIAPEQAFGEPIDGRSDLYALACVAWWLLCASEIYPRGTDESETLRQHIQEPVPSLRARVKGWLPQELEDVIYACLAKRASDRPRDARDMIQRLRAIHVPEEYAWSELRANAWWHNYKPTLVVISSADQPTMDQAPSPVESSELPTAAGHGPAKLVVPRFDRR